MAQQGIKNDLALQFASSESGFFGKYHRNNLGDSCNSGDLDVPEWSTEITYVGKTGYLESFNKGENAGQNNLPAQVENPGITSNCGLENTNPVAPQDPMSGSVVSEQYSALIRSKAPDGTPNFREIVFDSAANASTPYVQEISSVKGRTGPMSPKARARAILVRNNGGACWRCKFLGKGCDAGDPCSSCPQKATAWHALGCRRGTLWDVLPRVVLCPQAGEQPGSTPDDHPKNTISIAKEHVAIANLANMYLPLPQGGCTSSLLRLLSSAARYQATAANDRLIELSWLCLQVSLEAIHAQEESQLHNFPHTACTSFACEINNLNKLNTCLREYIKLLSDVIFKKNAKHRKDWWLSVFYSFCIQSFVRGALIVLASKSNTNQATAASLQYLHLALNLFFVTCNATSKGYDPLLFDFDNLSSLESSNLDKNYLQAEEGRRAQIAVQKESWKINGIDSSYDYLGQLFGMDRTIFVPPPSRPPVYGDGSETIATIDEATRPPPKKRRLDKKSEHRYTSDDPITTQMADTHIIHPGSLLLLDSTAELPPPFPDLNNYRKVRENSVKLESDMYTPRLIRGFRDEEGWCGFCSRWLKLGDAWFNDRCLFHGICADTGKGFAEPKSPVKICYEKQIWEAKCETCGETVRYRKGDQRHYSGWYMHAANCDNKSPVAEIGEETVDDIATWLGW